MPDAPRLSNIRDHLGWLTGRTIVDVTAGDPKAFPDHDPSDEWTIVLHLDNGGMLEIPVGDEGVTCNDPDSPDEEECAEARRLMGCE